MGEMIKMYQEYYIDPNMKFSILRDTEGKTKRIGFDCSNMNRTITLEDLYDLKALIEYVIGEVVKGEDNHEVE